MGIRLETNDRAYCGQCHRIATCTSYLVTFPREGVVICEICLRKAIDFIDEAKRSEKR
jgi:hypothetical protein